MSESVSQWFLLLVSSPGHAAAAFFTDKSRRTYAVFVLWGVVFGLVLMARSLTMLTTMLSGFALSFVDGGCDGVGGWS